MYRFLWMLFIFMGVWIVAALLNGFLSSICMILFCIEQREIFGIPLLLLISFVIGVPMFAFIGLGTYLGSVITGKKGFDLFQVTLRVTLISVIIGTLFIFTVESRPALQYILSSTMIFSAFSGIIIFRNQIKQHE